MNTSRQLAKWVTDFKLNPADTEIISETRKRIFDFVVSAMAGYKVNPVFNKAVERVADIMSNQRQSSVLFKKQKQSIINSAFINATYGHGADLDDGHKTANGHPGVATIPAILALAEYLDSSPMDVYEAMIIGYEVYIRVSNAVQPSLLHRGFHGTGVVGAIAASAACAKLLKLDERKTHNAISLGAVQASGLFEVSESGQMAKPINPANACSTGIIAALLANEGAEGPDNPLEGKKGFFGAFADKTDLNSITETLGKELLIKTAYYKMYPACRHLHPEVDAAAMISKERQFNTNEIEKITITTYHNALLVTGNIMIPRSVDDAKFSMVYATIRGLQHGNYDFNDLHVENGISQETIDLIKKTVIMPDESFEDKEKNIRGGQVTVDFKDGTSICKKVLLPKGDPEFPFDNESFRKKLSFCADGLLSKDKQNKLYNYFFCSNDFCLKDIYEMLERDE